MPNPSNLQKINFDRCDHRILGTCSAQAEGCCGVVACNLCIEITNDYTEEVVDRKVAPFSSPGYAATFGVVVFEAYWQRDYATGECVFVVEVTDAVETQVLKFSKCYDAAACMAPAGDVVIQYNGKSHVLSWEPLDIVTLKNRVEGKCKKPFCGECTCAPRELCIRMLASGCVVSELVSLEPTECKEEEPPVWEFTLTCPGGSFSISGTVSLRREEYTDACILNVVIPEHYIDYDYEWIECPAIEGLTFSFPVPTASGDVDVELSIESADCEMCTEEPLLGCCDLDFTAACSNIPKTLTVDMRAIGDCAAWDGFCFTLFYSVISNKWVSGCVLQTAGPGGPCDQTLDPCGCCFNNGGSWIPTGLIDTPPCGFTPGNLLWMAAELECVLIDGQETFVLRWTCQEGTNGGANEPAGSPIFSNCVRPIDSGTCSPIVWNFNISQICCNISQSGIGFTITELGC